MLDADARLAASRAAPDGRTRLRAFIAAWGNYIPEVHGVVRAFLAMRETDEAARAAWDDRRAAVRHGCAAAVRALTADGILRADLDEEAATDLLWSLLSVPVWQHLTIDCGWSQARYIAELTRLAEAAVIT